MFDQRDQAFFAIQDIIVAVAVGAGVRVAGLKGGARLRQRHRRRHRRFAGETGQPGLVLGLVAEVQQRVNHAQRRQRRQALAQVALPQVLAGEHIAHRRARQAGTAQGFGQAHQGQAEAGDARQHPGVGGGRFIGGTGAGRHCLGGKAAHAFAADALLLGQSQVDRQIGGHGILINQSNVCLTRRVWHYFGVTGKSYPCFGTSKD